MDSKVTDSERLEARGLSLFPPESQYYVSDSSEQWTKTEKSYLVIALERARLIRATKEQIWREYDEAIAVRQGKARQKLIKPTTRFRRWLKQKGLTTKKADTLLRRLEVVDVLMEGGLQDPTVLSNLEVTHFDMLLDQEIPQEFLYVCARFLNEESYHNFLPEYLTPLIASAKIQLHPETTALIKRLVDEGEIEPVDGAALLSVLGKIQNEPEIKEFAKNMIEQYLRIFIDEQDDKRIKVLLKNLKALEKIDQLFYLTSDFHQIENLPSALTEAERIDQLSNLSGILMSINNVILLCQKTLEKRQKLDVQLDRFFVQIGTSTPSLQQVVDSTSERLVRKPITINGASINILDNISTPG